jgi:DNA helicase-2/ATP-dependent DNA helicase PcrA
MNLELLNEPQRLATTTVSGPLLLLAGAGSGKTRVITHRVAYLMEEGINPYNILAITFTNKAAAEMRDRVNNIVGDGAERVWVSTFHSLCVRILRRFADRLGYGTNFNIYDTDDQKTAIKHILKELNIDSKKYPEKMFMAEISKAKEQYISPNEYSRVNALDYQKTQVAKVYTEYMERLKKYNAFDFDDLIYKTVELFEHNPDVLELYQDRFRYIMVDEYQDTNHIQFLFVKLLAGKYKNLCVVGDDDQSIYKFRGANITNILNFEKEYPDTRVIKLEQNYRSCGNILSAANAVIKHNAGRKDKSLWTDKEGGDKISFNLCEDEYMEADRVVNEIIKLAGAGVPYRDMAILYRTNAQSRILGEKLVLRGVPHRVYGGQNFYDRKEIKDIMAYLKVINNDADDTYIRRIINVPKRGIGDASVDKAVIYANGNKITIMEALHDVDNIPGLSRAAGKIKGFVELIDSFKNMLAEQESLDSIFDRILEDTGYEDELIAENTDEAASRLENIDELRNRVIQFQEDNEEATLSDFLEDTALVSETDKMSEDDNMVRLMTLHGAKGLEFPYVFMCGMEERIFPSAMAINSEDEDALEEERRLCYVGITRAMKKLYLSAARFRMMHGQRNVNDISRFVREIPPLLIDDAGEIARINRRREERSYMDGGSFGGGNYSSHNMNGTSYSGYNKSNPYSSYKNITPSVKQSFGKEFVVNKVLKLDYAEGDRVRHIKYGNGTVTQIVQGGKDYEVTVDFDRCGIRKMFASFAKLQKI